MSDIYYLNPIMNNRKMTLYDLYIKLQFTISLKRLSEINIGKTQIMQKDIDLMNMYLNLTAQELSYLNVLLKENIVFKSENTFSKLLGLIPNSLKRGQFYKTTCPYCNSDLIIYNYDYSDYKSMICTNEGLLLIQ